MKFFNLTITLALVISIVSASVSPSVQQCIDSIQDANDQAEIVKDRVISWSLSTGYIGSLSVHGSELTYESKLETAIDICCAMIASSWDDFFAIVDAFGSLKEAIVALLEAFIARKPDFDMVPLVTSLFVNDVVNLKNLFDQLLGCINSAGGSISDCFDNPFEDYGGAIVDSFAEAYLVFDIF